MNNLVPVVSEGQGMLIGTPIYWPDKELPSDNFVWVLGQSFDKVEFPELAKRYPSGVLPDPRWDFFRVVGTDQTALSKHGNTVQPLSFAGNALPAHGHNAHGGHNFGSGSRLQECAQGSGRVFSALTSTSAGTPTGTIKGTGSETRPKNMLWYCIMRVR